ncbi:MAG: GAF domain-containing protein, partial [Dehalococcoidia bacterium]
MAWFLPEASKDRTRLIVAASGQSWHPAEHLFCAPSNQQDRQGAFFTNFAEVAEPTGSAQGSKFGFGRRHYWDVCARGLEDTSSNDARQIPIECIAGKLITEVRHDGAQNCSRQHGDRSGTMTAPDMSQSNEIARLRAENAALRYERDEALQQQTATSEVLRVISRSPTDLPTVFHAITQNAKRLTASEHSGLLLLEGTTLRVVANVGGVAGVGTLFDAGTPSAASARAIVERRTVHIFGGPEAIEVEFPVNADLWRRSGTRSSVIVPLLKNGEAIGTLQVRRPRPDPYTPAQIALFESFAAQAVIAIENARLFEEIQRKNQELADRNLLLSEALEQQTATSEILQVISSSPVDLQPVFDTIISNAARLCGADVGLILRVEGDLLQPVGVCAFGQILRIQGDRHHPVVFEETGRSASFPPQVIDGNPLAGRALVERRPIHIPDVLAEPADRFPTARARAQSGGYRTILNVPLLREDLPVGVITLYRLQAAPFSEQQIELIKTFADQAVIAMENGRLFQEVQTRNRELTEALEQQTAMAEVLQILGNSPMELPTVLESVLQHAVTLCGGENGILLAVDGDQVRTAATFGPTGSVARRETFVPDDETGIGRALRSRSTIHVADTLSVDFQHTHRRGYASTRRTGVRAFLATPLLSRESTIGAISVGRNRPGPFTDGQIALLETFANQAVIAIENARLFEEIQQKGRELEEANTQLAAASRHKSEFLASMSHELRTPLNAILGFSEVLLERMFGELNDKQDEYLQDILSSGQHL